MIINFQVKLILASLPSSGKQKISCAPKNMIKYKYESTTTEFVVLATLK